MNRDDIIRMAREADLNGEILWLNKRIVGYEEEIAFVERFAALVAAAEREECAKVAAWILKMPENDVSAAIRARGSND